MTLARETTSLARGWASMLGAALSLSLGCVIEVPNESHGACDDVRCSIDGYCRNGDCYCERGYLGNPNALHGCQSTEPGTGCTTTCGLNAFCDTGACVCDDGFIAVCGTGDCLPLRQLCDGVPDCPNLADEAAQTCAQQEVQQWTVVDDCDDGLDIEWRMWSQERDWTWPDASSVFVSDGLGRPSHEEIECLRGEWICFGGQGGDRSWGIGVEGTGDCEDCCFRCLEDPVDLGRLACE